MNALFTALMLSGVTSSPKVEDLESIGAWNTEDRPTINDFFSSNNDDVVDDASEGSKNTYSAYSDHEAIAPTSSQPVYFPPMEAKSSSSNYLGINYPLKPKESRYNGAKGAASEKTRRTPNPIEDTVEPRELSPTDF